MATSSQRIVLKIGTGVLTRSDRICVDDPVFVDLARAIAALQRDGHRIVVVSSGAVGAGLMERGRKDRPEDTATLQAFAAMGQTRLMHHWKTHLQYHDIVAAQLLLTYDDLESEDRRARILRTIERLLDFGDVVPVINENDSVAVEELRFGDNDALSAHVAALTGADLLVLLTTVDGLLDRSRAEGQQLVRVVEDLDAADVMVEDTQGHLSVGGMRTKLEAVGVARDHGIPAIIAHGKHTDRLPGIIAGEDLPCTRFPLPTS